MRLEKLQQRLRKMEEKEDAHQQIDYFMEASRNLAEAGDVIMGSLKLVKEKPSLGEKVGQRIEDKIVKTLTALVKIANFYNIDLEKAFEGQDCEDE